ncbi:MAG: hypothetical protein M1828_000617 [Chrysothrix sp. TS-e1954]|nr:MAG: hypothetical protein M1828_000617 [Chrysothrix sp. TS-e1954]
MHLQQAESTGPQNAQESPVQSKSTQNEILDSSVKSFGTPKSLSSIVGPTYLNAQALVQQAAFTLSDKIYTYSPDTFDLDTLTQQWQLQEEKNGFGDNTRVVPMQTRTGAGLIALGNMFSKDFDMTKRHVPQSILASAGSLKQLRASLDELSLLYNVASPLVTHVAAVDYNPSVARLATDYVTSMSTADELGLGLLASTSTFEVQHMSLLVTLLAKHFPALHTYDGVQVGRETTRVVDVLDQAGLFMSYSSISAQLSEAFTKRSSIDDKVTRTLHAFNNELGTDYKPFEYYGHSAPDSVLVVFGSVEGSLAAQLAHALGNNGAKVGAVNVRVYRPFLEDDFLEALPKSVKRIAILGQVENVASISDSAEHSLLYIDVLAAVTLSTRFANQPSVIDSKYAKEEAWTPSKMLAALQQISQSAESDQITESQDRPNLDVLSPSVQQYSFWDVDDSLTINAPSSLATLFSRKPSENVTLRTGHDNLTRGGIIRSDIRCSAKSIEAPYSITAANVAYVGEEKILQDVNVLSTVKQKGSIVVRLPSSKDQDMERFEKRLPAAFRDGLIKNDIQLYVLDPQALPQVVENASLEGILSQVAFLRVACEDFDSTVSQLSHLVADAAILKALADSIDTALRQIEIPETWSSTEESEKAVTPPADISLNSFAPFEKTQKDEPTFLKTWLTAAKGLCFREATHSSFKLRPDTPVRTATVHVSSRQRLTPASYDRNIFHITFALGDSGLEYKIGEALGIHAENDRSEVEEFIKWYGLDPNHVVEVPAREDPDSMLENRTVYQSLMQNIDILGRPPKRFYEALADFADDPNERKELLSLGGPEGANEFKRRAEVDTVTYADILLDFPSAHPAFHDIVRMVSPMKRREYSIASSQKVQPDTVSLLIVTVNWVDPTGRDRFGQATRYLDFLPIGAPVTVSVKPSVMKLPPSTTSPLIMAGLGTGLAPFRAFVQERAWEKQQGKEIGQILLYMGSRHQREEYLYGEEWEAYQDAGIITLLGRAFSRDQPQKVYIQDRMRQTLQDIRSAYLRQEGSFYLCGPTWPVPDVTEVLMEAIREDAVVAGRRKVDANREIEVLKDEGRYVLEVY